MQRPKAARQLDNVVKHGNIDVGAPDYLAGQYQPSALLRDKIARRSHVPTRVTVQAYSRITGIGLSQREVRMNGRFDPNQ